MKQTTEHHAPTTDPLLVCVNALLSYYTQPKQEHKGEEPRATA